MVASPVGRFARVGRNTLSASESASPSLPELIFSGPDVSGRMEEKNFEVTKLHNRR